MQQLSKFNFKINVKSNGLEKYMVFNINNKLVFIDSPQLLNSSIDNIVKNFCKDNFKYLSEEFHSKLLDLAKKKGFYPYEYMSDYEKLKEELQSKENFI